MAKITAPNGEFTGKRGPVAFIDGVGETDDPTMLAYFARHGYGVDGAAGVADAAAAPAEKPADQKAAAKPSDA